MGKQYEHGGIARDGAKMVHAVANADVPKFTVIVGGSYGAGNYGMCGRAYDPRLLWMWPNAKICVMGGEQAANVLLTVKKRALEKKGIKMTKKEEEEFMAPTLEKYETEYTKYITYTLLQNKRDGFTQLLNETASMNRDQIVWADAAKFALHILHENKN